MHPDTLLAYSMNGEKLPPSMGFPLRAVIPGWYGMDSVKWLRSVNFERERSRIVASAPYVRATRSCSRGSAGRVRLML